MQARILKEIRLLLPAWLLTVALVAALGLVRHGSAREWAVTVFVFGCPLIAASLFGAEFGHGTISQLLSQPISRRRIWYEKMGVLAFALGMVLALGLFFFSAKLDHSMRWLVMLVPICVFCSTPFFTFLARSTIGALILSMAGPMFLYLGAGALVLWFFKSGALASRPNADDFIDEVGLHRWLICYFGVALPIYCIGLYYLGYRWFGRLQVANLLERQIRLAKSVPVLIDGILRRTVPRPVAALLGKEFHLQHNAFTLLIIFSGLLAAAIVYIKVAKPESPEVYFHAPLFIYIALMPLIIGSSAVAEERKLGTLGWSLTFPISRRRQWLIKLVAVLVCTAVLGALVPLLWLGIGNIFLGSQIAPFGWWQDSQPASLFCCSLLLTSSIAFYASSFSRDTLRALVLGAGLCVFVGFGIGWTDRLIEKMRWDWFAQIHIFGRNIDIIGRPDSWGGERVEMHAISGAFLCLSILMLLSSLKHFRKLDTSLRQVLPNLFAIFLPTLLLFFFLRTISVSVTTNAIFRGAKLYLRP